MVAKFLALNNLSCQERLFALSSDGRKVRAFFSSAIYAGPGLAGIQKFCYHGPLTQQFRLSIEAEIKNDPNYASAVVSSWLGAWTPFISSWIIFIFNNYSTNARWI